MVRIPTINSTTSVSSFGKQYTPIHVLKPGITDFVLKARITYKSPIKTYTNRNVQGKIASIEVIDAQGGEIKCLIFNQQVDRFYKMIELSQIYEISGGKVKRTNKKYQNCDNDYMLTIDRTT